MHMYGRISAAYGFIQQQYKLSQVGLPYSNKIHVIARNNCKIIFIYSTHMNCWRFNKGTYPLIFLRFQ